MRVCVLALVLVVAEACGARSSLEPPDGGRGGTSATGGEPNGGRGEGASGGTGANGGEGATGGDGASGGGGAPPFQYEGIYAGGLTSCYLRDGDVWCWGWNEYGQLGQGHTEDIGDDETLEGLEPIDLGGRAVWLSVGTTHACAVLEGAHVRCWGANNVGQLGYGHTENIGDDESPASAGDVGVDGAVEQVAAGFGITCVLLNGGAVRCWGVNDTGQLGYGHTEWIGDDELPSSAGDVELGGPAYVITAGAHVCAVLLDGKVRCWGYGGLGSLGYGNTENVGDDEVPADVGNVDVGADIIWASAGRLHTCGVAADGRLRCWGSNSGHPGEFVVGDDETPASLGDVDLGGPVARLATGYDQTCVNLQDGTLRCWGPGYTGALGYGNTAFLGDDETPASAGPVPVGEAVVGIAAGEGHTCALLADHRIRCWGQGVYGQLGNGSTATIGDDEPASAATVFAF